MCFGRNQSASASDGYSRSQPFLLTYLSQNPAISEVTIDVRTSATKNVSDINPRSKATVACTMPGPPLALRAIARLRLGSLLCLMNLPTTKAPPPLSAVEKTRNQRKKRMSEEWTRSSFNQTTVQ